MAGYSFRPGPDIARGLRRNPRNLSEGSLLHLKTLVDPTLPREFFKPRSCVTPASPTTLGIPTPVPASGFSAPITNPTSFKCARLSHPSSSSPHSPTALESSPQCTIPDCNFGCKIVGGNPTRKRPFHHPKNAHSTSRNRTRLSHPMT